MHPVGGDLVRLLFEESEGLLKMWECLGAPAGPTQDFGEVSLDPGSGIQPVSLLDQLRRCTNHRLACVELTSLRQNFP